VTKEVSVAAFVKEDNKIIKSITDYGRQSPTFRINIEPLTCISEVKLLERNKTIKDFQKKYKS
jgi:hypothetical protein